MANKKVTELTSSDAVSSTDLIYFGDDPGGTPLSKARTFFEMFGDLQTGTVFPTTDLYEGQRFYRTDLNIDCFYDGADWVTCAEYTVELPEATYAATTSSAIQWVGDIYQPKWQRFEVRAFVDTTNDGTHYWNVYIRQNNLAAGSQNNVSITTTISLAPDTWLDLGEPAENPTDAAYGVAFFTVAKADTPGNITCSMLAKYRLIIP